MFLSIFLKIFFFMQTIFEVFIKFVIASVFMFCFLAMRHVGFKLFDQRWKPYLCIGRWSPNPWIAREIPESIFYEPKSK